MLCSSTGMVFIAIAIVVLSTLMLRFPRQIKPDAVANKPKGSNNPSEPLPPKENEEEHEPLLKGNS